MVEESPQIEVTAKLFRLLMSGRYQFTEHALESMDEDRLTLTTSSARWEQGAFAARAAATVIIKSKAARLMVARFASSLVGRECAAYHHGV